MGVPGRVPGGRVHTDPSEGAAPERGPRGLAAFEKRSEPRVLHLLWPCPWRGSEGPQCRGEKQWAGSGCWWSGGGTLCLDTELGGLQDARGGAQQALPKESRFLGGSGCVATLPNSLLLTKGPGQG